MNDKISVIVPIYNVEQYLKTCVDSIINQTHTNLEIILVNDGSPDNCATMCEEYAVNDSRIVIIHKVNGGISDARNVGLDVATGDYVSFIDADDYIYEKFYETLLNIAIQNDADIAQCDFMKVFEEEKHTMNKLNLNEAVTILSNFDSLHNLYNKHYINSVVVWNKLYKINLFHYIRFPKGKIHEDDSTTYKVLFQANKVAMIPNQYYFYLQRASSITGKKFDVKNLHKIQAYYDQINFFKEKKLFDLENMAMIRFESIIREKMSEVLFSNVPNKEGIFENLIHYYRQHYPMLKNITNINFKKKMLMLVSNNSPKIIIKFMCTLMYLQANVISKQEAKSQITMREFPLQ